VEVFVDIIEAEIGSEKEYSLEATKVKRYKREY
jgi:hypothetical protein